MQHLEVSGAVRPLKWSLGVKWLKSVRGLTVTRRFVHTYNDMIYLLTAIGLTPGGSNTVHIYTQTVHRTIQNKHNT